MKRLAAIALILCAASVVEAQNTSYVIMPTPRLQWLKNDGNPASGYKICTYAAGTSTPLAVYADNAGTTLPNPFTLNSAGIAQTAGSTETGVYVGANSYKFTMYAPGTGNLCNGVHVGALVRSQDNVYDLALLFTTSFATKLDDKICHASQWTGADEGAKIGACIAVLPSTGGIVDARGLEGNQSWATCPFTGVTKPIELYLNGGVHSIAGCTLSLSNLKITGIGKGNFDGTNAATTLKYAGVGTTAIFETESPVAMLEFENLQFDGNAKTGYGIWLKNNAAAILHVQGNNVSFVRMLTAIKVGGDAGTASNYNHINFSNCDFYDDVIDVQVSSTNTEFMKFSNCQTQEADLYNFQATAGAMLNLEHFYFGPLTMGATGAVSGPWVLRWADVWSEIGNFFLIAATSTASYNQSSSITGSYLARRGDADNYSIYWDGGMPLEISGSSVTGLLRWDARRQGNQIYLNGVQFNPVVDSEIVNISADPSGARPLIIGTFTGTNDEYCIKISTGGTIGTTQFQWKASDTTCTSGSYSSSITIPLSGKYRFSNGLIAAFPAGINWTLNSAWMYPVSKTGLEEFGGVVKPEPFNGVRATLAAPYSINDNTETVLKYDTKTFDTYDQYDPTTGVFTAMARGFYEIEGRITWPGGLGDPPNAFSIAIFVNGTRYTESDLTLPGATANMGVSLTWTTSTVGVMVHDFAYLNAGDTVEFRVLQDTSGAATPIGSSPNARHNMFIRRVASTPDLTQ